MIIAFWKVRFDQTLFPLAREKGLSSSEFPDHNFLFLGEILYARLLGSHYAWEKDKIKHRDISG